MARVSREQTLANREAIEGVSARLFREQGLDGVSVADLMAAAGLTHGGFYGHFASKDALAAVACTNAFEQSLKRRSKWLGQTENAAAALHAITGNYLTTRHRDSPGQGCPVVALATDVGRQAQDKPVRTAYLSGVKRMADDLEGLSPGADASQRRAQALACMATMVGAVLLARATAGDPLSDEILDAARSALGVEGDIDPRTRHVDVAAAGTSISGAPSIPGSSAV